MILKTWPESRCHVEFVCNHHLTHIVLGIALVWDSNFHFNIFKWSTSNVRFLLYTNSFIVWFHIFLDNDFDILDSRLKFLFKHWIEFLLKYFESRKMFNLNFQQIFFSINKPHQTFVENNESAFLYSSLSSNFSSFLCISFDVVLL